jgi:hypothetical protein
MNFILFFIFGKMSFTEKNLIETPVMISEAQLSSWTYIWKNNTKARW